MSGRAILIADRDAAYRNGVADRLRETGIQVESVGSAEEALNSVLHHGTSVLVMGSDLSERSTLADLVHLLKACNRRLRIILVSDQMTLAETRQIRQAGIFYHALKATPGNSEELGQVVACAFGDRDSPTPPLRKRPAEAAAAHFPRIGQVQLGKVLPWLVGTVALILGAGVVALQGCPANVGSSLTIWIFLGFLALVVTNQLLPIFRVKLALESLKEWKAARSGARRGTR